MEEVPPHDPRAGRASETLDCFTLVLAAAWRETPLFRQAAEIPTAQPCQGVAEKVRAFGVEGTGSYGAGLARFLSSRGFTVVEVNRPDRSTRYRKGKSDPTDAKMAARAVLAGVANATPKSGEGEIEMIHMLKSTKDSAVKARTQAVNQMKALVVTAPAVLRETLDGLTSTALAARCKSFRPGRLEDPAAAAKYALRSLACRYLQLDREIRDLQAELERLTRRAQPQPWLASSG